MAIWMTLVPAMLVWGAIVFAGRMKNWARGAPDRRRPTPKIVARRLDETGHRQYPGGGNQAVEHLARGLAVELGEVVRDVVQR